MDFVLYETISSVLDFDAQLLRLRRCLLISPSAVILCKAILAYFLNIMQSCPFRESAPGIDVPIRCDTVKAEFCVLNGDGQHEETDCGLTDGEGESCPYPLP